eukprot:COSAG01_NODE_35807_length_526_cov_1.072600_1_plen_161_part_01
MRREHYEKHIQPVMENIKSEKIKSPNIADVNAHGPCEDPETNSGKAGRSDNNAASIVYFLRAISRTISRTMSRSMSRTMSRTISSPNLVAVVVTPARSLRTSLHDYLPDIAGIDTYAWQVKSILRQIAELQIEIEDVEHTALKLEHFDTNFDKDVEFGKDM